MEMSLLALFRTIYATKDCMNTKMEMSMKDFGRMTSNREAENSFSKLGNNTKDNSIKE
jgi:hypothetical protein